MISDRLEDLIDGSRTDKNTTHSYIPLYQKLLESKKDTATHILEIGIYSGGSIKLWRDYFLNATIYGIDIMHRDDVWPVINLDPRVILYTSTDAYNHSLLDSFGTKFDMVLDDGPHTLESMIFFVSCYSKLLNDDGILILEDVQDWNWIATLKEYVPADLKQYIEIYDLRSVKGQYDDIVFVINKNKYI